MLSIGANNKTDWLDFFVKGRNRPFPCNEKSFRKQHLCVDLITWRCLFARRSFPQRGVRHIPFAGTSLAIFVILLCFVCVEFDNDLYSPRSLVYQLWMCGQGLLDELGWHHSLFHALFGGLAEKGFRKIWLDEISFDSEVTNADIINEQSE